MTMFKKVFGSQITASEEEISVPEEALLAENIQSDDFDETLATPPRSRPLMTPVQQVLSYTQAENEKRRAEKAKEIEAQLLTRRPNLTLEMEEPKLPSPDDHVYASSGSFDPPPLPPAAPPAPVRPLPEPSDTAASRQPRISLSSPTPETAEPVSSRARTRLLGFRAKNGNSPADPMSGPATTADTRTHPTGWVTIVSGAGQGHFFPIFSGVSSIGRDDNQAISLCFGDDAISRENHAAIAYDDEDQSFYVGHGGKSNIIRLNGRPVLSTEKLNHGDELRIGETILRFAALCDEGFSWSGQRDV